MPSFLLLTVLASIYFLPSIIVGIRNHPQLVGIVLLNTLAGWTVIGWLVALIWSVRNYEKP